MNATTTDIIVARSREADRLSSMIVWSVAAHVVVMAVIGLAPHPQSDLKQEEPMMISLGGAPGPRTGMTQMSARNVQAVQPDVKKAETAPSPVAKEKPKYPERSPSGQAVAEWLSPAAEREAESSTA